MAFKDATPVGGYSNRYQHYSGTVKGVDWFITYDTQTDLMTFTTGGSATSSFAGNENFIALPANKKCVAAQIFMCDGRTSDAYDMQTNKYSNYIVVTGAKSSGWSPRISSTFMVTDNS